MSPTERWAGSAGQGWGGHGEGQGGTGRGAGVAPGQQSRALGGKASLRSLPPSPGGWGRSPRRRGPHQLHERLQHVQIASSGRGAGQARSQGVAHGIGLLGGGQRHPWVLSASAPRDTKPPPGSSPAVRPGQAAALYDPFPHPSLSPQRMSGQSCNGAPMWEPGKEHLAPHLEGGPLHAWAELPQAA